MTHLTYSVELDEFTLEHFGQTIFQVIEIENWDNGEAPERVIRKFHAYGAAWDKSAAEKAEKDAYAFADLKTRQLAAYTEGYLC